MQVVLTHADLTLMVEGFTKVVPEKARPAILHYVKFEPAGGADAAVTATNGDETLIYRATDAIHSMEGARSFLFPFSELKRMASEVGKGKQAELIAVGDKSVHVVVSTNAADLTKEVAYLPAKDFPETLKAVPLKPGDISALVEAYRRALPFASIDNMSHALNGVFFHHEEHCVAATDRHRVFKLGLTDSPLDADVIMPPSKVLKSDLLDYGQGTGGVLTGNGESWMEIGAGPWRFQVRGIEGRYPNYGQVVPALNAPYPGEIAFDLSSIELIQHAFRQVTDREHGNVTLYGDTQQVLLISDPRTDTNERNHVPLPLTAARFDSPLVVSFNSTYFQDALQAGMSTVRLPDAIAPLLFTDNDADALCALMCCNLGNTQEIMDYVATAANHGKPQENESMSPEASTALATNTSPVTSPNTASPSPATNANTNPSNALKVLPTTAQPGESAGTDTQDTNTSLDGTESSISPLNDLLDSINTTQKQIQDAATGVRDLKRKLRAVVQMYRAREKQNAATLTVLEKLKQAANF